MHDDHQIELPDSTIELTINGDDTAIHYSMFTENVDYNSLADEIHTALEEHDAITITDDEKVTTTGGLGFFDEIPMLTNVLWEMTSISFYDYNQGVDDIFTIETDLIPTEEESWIGTEYNGETPTVAQTISAYICLLNASKANDILTPSGPEDDDSIGSLFTEERFDQEVELGFMLALRDAHTDSHSPFQPAILFGMDEAVADAVENALGVSLSEKALHALLLSQREKNYHLRMASQQGQKETTEQSMKALSDLSKGLQQELE